MQLAISKVLAIILTTTYVLNMQKFYKVKHILIIIVKHKYLWSVS